MLIKAENHTGQATSAVYVGGPYGKVTLSNGSVEKRKWVNGEGWLIL